MGKREGEVGLQMPHGRYYWLAYVFDFVANTTKAAALGGKPMTTSVLPKADTEARPARRVSGGTATNDCFVQQPVGLVVTCFSYSTAKAGRQAHEATWRQMASLLPSY